MKKFVLILLIAVNCVAIIIATGYSVNQKNKAPQDTFVPEDKEITVMSFNIRTYGFEDRPDKYWDYRREEVVGLIKRHNPDIIGIQEANDIQMQFLKENLTEYGYCGKNNWDDSILSPLMGGTNAVFYKKDRFLLDSERTLWLSDTPEVRSSSWSPKSDDYRALTEVKLTDKYNLKTLTYINTHLALTEYAQEKSCRMLTALADQTEGAIIISGDFNHQQDTPIYQIMAGGKLKDSCKLAADSDSGGTFHSFNGKIDKPWPKPIDFIFVTDTYLEPISYKIIRDHNDKNEYPSDHFPIKTVLKYKATEEDMIDPRVIEVTENFIAKYWDPHNEYFFLNNTNKTDWIHTAGPGLGTYTDFWVEAQNWETVMDIYERQGGSFYRVMIDKVYDGFKSYYPDFTKNDYNDDIGWWAMGCTRAYKLTNNARYLTAAKEMFDYIYGNNSEELGGGIYWNVERKGKNVCTNAPAAVTAARLSVLLGDESYLQKSIGLFDWLKTHLYEEDTGKVNDTAGVDGSIYKGQFTYNYGTFARAAYELYKVTGNGYYLDYVEKPIDYLLSTKTEDGILITENGGDGAAFRVIFLRTLNMVAKERRPDYQQIINKNALATYNNRRASDMLCGHDWTKPPKDGDLITSVMVATSVSLMQFYKEN